MLTIIYHGMVPVQQPWYSMIYHGMDRVSLHTISKLLMVFLIYQLGFILLSTTLFSTIIFTW